MPRERLSTSDYTVLGIVWRDGPCTTYAVMLRLASSPSSLFRKRASSTYSVVQKLMSRGLLQPVGDEVGSRGDRQIALTGKGMEVLQQWLSPPIPQVDVAYSNDLVRLRLNFIGALATEQQVDFVEAALDAMRQLEKEQANAVQGREGPSLIAIMGLLFETRARIAWLETVRTMVPLPAEGPKD